MQCQCCVPWLLNGNDISLILYSSYQIEMAAVHLIYVPYCLLVLLGENDAEGGMVASRIGEKRGSCQAVMVAQC